MLSIAGDLQICQVVDPLKTCRYALPKTVAEQLSLSIDGGQSVSVEQFGYKQEPIER